MRFDIFQRLVNCGPYVCDYTLLLAAEGSELGPGWRRIILEELLGGWKGIASNHYRRGIVGGVGSVGRGGGEICGRPTHSPVAGRNRDQLSEVIVTALKRLRRSEWVRTKFNHAGIHARTWDSYLFHVIQLLHIYVFI